MLTHVRRKYMYIIDARLLLRKDYSMPIKLDIGR